MTRPVTTFMACDNCGHPDYCHGRWAGWKFWRWGRGWCDWNEHHPEPDCRCRHWGPKP